MVNSPADGLMLTPWQSRDVRWRDPWVSWWISVAENLLRFPVFFLWWGTMVTIEYYSWLLYFSLLIFLVRQSNGKQPCFTTREELLNCERHRFFSWFLFCVFLHLLSRCNDHVQRKPSKKIPRRQDRANGSDRTPYFSLVWDMTRNGSAFKSTKNPNHLVGRCWKHLHLWTIPPTKRITLY